ncbi:MAG: pentapeptide repeat-containing protein [Cyanobacteria bacterium J06555_13]
MTDIDFLSLIEEGAECWNQWRIDHPTVQPNLNKAYLFGQVLAGFNLRGVNLERACLIGANLQGANLKNAQLQSVYASSADFKGADLRKAMLQGSSFGQANFSGANLSGAQAFGTNFSGAVFTGACLSAWHIDKTTVLSGIEASHIYLRDHRNPHTGAFQPGALEPFLRLAAVQSTAIPTTLGVAPVGKLTVNLRGRVQTLINSEAASKLRDRLQPAALNQTRQQVSELVTQTVTAMTICVVEQARAIQNSEVAGHLIIAFHPDSPDHITPGALYQLNPTVTARLKALIHALLEIEAVRLTLQGTSHQTRQLHHKTQAALRRGIEAFSQSKAGATLTVVTQSRAGRCILTVFEPDGTTRVTTGVLSPYLQQFNAKQIGQATVKSTVSATRQSVEQLKVLFTPDSVERVTVGKLHQLSPDTLSRIERVLLLETIYAVGAKIGEVSAIAKLAAMQRIRLLSQSAGFVHIATWMHSAPIGNVTRHFKPDGVDCVTQGVLHGMLQKGMAQHKLDDGLGGGEQVRSPLKSTLRLLASPLVNPATRPWGKWPLQPQPPRTLQRPRMPHLPRPPQLLPFQTIQTPLVFPYRFLRLPLSPCPVRSGGHPYRPLIKTMATSMKMVLFTTVRSATASPLMARA